MTEPLANNSFTRGFFILMLSDQEKTLIYLFFSFNNKRLKYSTREHILPIGWNPSSQRARSNTALNDYLKKLAGNVIDIERQLRTDGVKVTPQIIKTHMDELLERSKKVTHTLFSFIEEYIQRVEKTKTISTIKGYRNTFNHLKEYKSYKRKNIDFDDVDQQFYDDFIDYLTNNKSFAKNTIGKQIKNLKVFMSEAFELGITKNQEYKRKKFRVITEEVESIYLDEVELERIFNLDLSSNSRLEKVRDLFIVGCYAGLRFSDFSSLKPENIDLKKNMISVKTVKMKKMAVIPIHPYVSLIIKKYRDKNNNNLPTAISNQKMNDYLKEIGKLSGISSCKLPKTEIAFNNLYYRNNRLNPL